MPAGKIVLAQPRKLVMKKRRKPTLQQQINQLKALNKPEYKLIDSYQSAVVASTGTFILCNGASLGDHAYDRDGNQARITSVRVRTYTEIHASATESIVRRVIFLNKYPNGAAPSLAGTLETSTATGATAFMNPNSFRDHKVLADDIVVLDQTHPLQYFPDRFFKLSYPVQYSDSSDTGTISDIIEGAVYVLYWSSEATNTPDVQGMHRVRFIDA